MISCRKVTRSSSGSYRPLRVLLLSARSTTKPLLLLSVAVQTAKVPFLTRCMRFSVTMQAKSRQRHSLREPKTQRLTLPSFWERGSFSHRKPKRDRGSLRVCSSRLQVLTASRVKRSITIRLPSIPHTPQFFIRTTFRRSAATIKERGADSLLHPLTQTSRTPSRTMARSLVCMQAVQFFSGLLTVQRCLLTVGTSSPRAKR